MRGAYLRARLPDEAPDRAVVFVLNVIRVPASEDRVAAERMVAHNRRLYERIRDRGCMLCPVSALPMSMADWQRHFGPARPGFQEARRRYDPAGILTPGYLSVRGPRVGARIVLKPSRGLTPFVASMARKKSPKRNRPNLTTVLDKNRLQL